MAKRNTQYRGCDHLVYALVTADTAAAYTTGEVKDLAVCKSVSRTFEQDSATVYGDNQAKIITQSAGKVTKSFEVFAIDPETLAEITGQELLTVGSGENAKKMIITKSNAVAPYIAVGYALYDTDDDQTPCEYVWCYKAKAKMPEKTSATIDDGTDSQGQTLEMECVQTIHNFEKVGTGGGGAVDMASPNLGTGYDMSKWWEKVITPDNASTELASA